MLKNRKMTSFLLRSMKKPVDNSKKKWCGDHMTGYAKKNPCKACVFRKPLNSLLGSFWDKKEFYFVIGGKQFVCEPDSCEIAKRRAGEGDEYV